MDLLRRCIDSDMLGSNSFVDILFAKYDLLKSSNNPTESREFIDSIKDELKSTFEKKVKKINLFNIAARPKDSKLEIGSGLDSVFKEWVEESPFTNYQGKSIKSKSYFKRAILNYTFH